MEQREVTIPEGLAIAGEYFKAGRLEEAARLFQQIAAIAPGNFDAAHGTGAVFGAQKQYDAALPWYDRAMGIALEQLFAVSLNKGSALSELNRTEEALNIINGVLAMRPDDIGARYHRGIVKMQLDDWHGAIGDFNAIIAVDPEYAAGDPIYCRGYCELALGEYWNGFRDYEYRARPPISAPEGSGEKLTGFSGDDLHDRTIMVIGEQGAGDIILFARYLPLLIARGAKVLALLPAPLVPLFDRISGVTAFSSHNGEQSDFWIHIGSLPYVFGTMIEDLPPPFPVEFSQSHLDKWRRIIPNDAGQFNIGLCWAGGTTHKFNRARSMPLAALEPIVRLREIFPRLRFFGLCPDIDQEAIDSLPIEHIGPRFQDYRRTAHALKTLDLVITVDTSVAHIAGLVDTRGIVMLSKARSYWIYPSNRHNTPWYPSLRTIRQNVEGNWNHVVHNIREVLMAELMT